MWYSNGVASFVLFYFSHYFFIVIKYIQLKNIIFFFLMFVFVHFIHVFLEDDQMYSAQERFYNYIRR